MFIQCIHLSGDTQDKENTALYATFDMYNIYRLDGNQPNRGMQMEVRTLKWHVYLIEKNFFIVPAMYLHGKLCKNVQLAKKDKKEESWIEEKKNQSNDTKSANI